MEIGRPGESGGGSDEGGSNGGAEKWFGSGCDEKAQQAGFADRLCPLGVRAESSSKSRDATTPGFPSHLLGETFLDPFSKLQSIPLISTPGPLPWLIPPTP